MRLSGTHLGDLRRVLGLLEVRVCGVGGVGGGDWIGICLFLFFMIERGLSLSESMRNWILEFQVWNYCNSLQFQKEGKEEEDEELKIQSHVWASSIIRSNVYFLFFY